VREDLSEAHLPAAITQLGRNKRWVTDEMAERVLLDPVFVMCNGRSGSTLLRFLLDAHPDLACPPETNLPGLCAQLATVWSLIEGAPLSANRGDEPPDIPAEAITGIRQTMDMMVGSYLARRGKRRYCDKSLGTARFADLLVRVYPRAKFLCLYRHPMDVIASGLEACPWGLNGYGFDPYIADTPGNSVLALARFWADNAGAVLAVEERYPDRCHRLRYEDLVADPEQTAAELFAFLGVAPAPGISGRCFSGERERFGPADYKIWRTSQVNSDSVGRGWSIPAGMISPPVLATVNELAGKLAYLPVDDGWGTSAPPADLRVAAATHAQEPGVSAAELGEPQHVRDISAVGDTADAGETEAAGAATAVVNTHPGSLGERLQSGLAVVTRKNNDWGPHAAETFVAVAVRGRTANTDYWIVDLKAGTVAAAGPQAQDKSDWDVVGSADVWEKVMSGQMNLNVALRSCGLRYCDAADAGPVAADTRLGILADLLGIPAW
jgi:hypothetical protein